MENSIDYDKIDSCADILYNFYYNRNKDKCYQFSVINKSSIVIEDLKKKTILIVNKYCKVNSPI